MKLEYKEPIPGVHSIVPCIIKGLENGDYLFDEHMKEENFPTDNGREGHIWNFYNREILANLPADLFQIVVEQRGPWKFLLVYDKQTQYLYTVMRQKRLAALRRDAEKEIFHYINALSRLNSGLASDYCCVNEQTTIWDMDNSEEQNATLDEILASLIVGLDGEVKRYVLVAFDIRNGVVTAIKGVIPAVGMGFYAEENWNDLGGVAFTDTGTDVQHDENDSIILLERRVSNNKPDIQRRYSDEKTANS